MLTPDQKGKHLTRERKSWHDADIHTPSMGCSICPERELCGKLHVGNAAYSCLDYCCNKPETCGQRYVCPRNEWFVDRVREIRGFSLENVRRHAEGQSQRLSPVISMVFHGKRRTAPIRADMVALPLAALFDRRNGNPKYLTRDALCGE